MTLCLKGASGVNKVSGPETTVLFYHPSLWSDG